MTTSCDGYAKRRPDGERPRRNSWKRGYDAFWPMLLQETAGKPAAPCSLLGAVAGHLWTLSNRADLYSAMEEP